jgi:hypothetical protein
MLYKKCSISTIKKSPKLVLKSFDPQNQPCPILVFNNKSNIKQFLGYVLDAAKQVLTGFIMLYVSKFII